MTRAILLTTVAAAATLAFALTASADDGLKAITPHSDTATAPLSIAQIATQLESEGYTVREIEMERGVYDVDLITPGGRWVEAYFDPATGASLGWDHDDDDYRYDD
jgi:hypothetical protein